MKMEEKIDANRGLIVIGSLVVVVLVVSLLAGKQKADSIEAKLQTPPAHVLEVAESNSQKLEEILAKVDRLMMLQTEDKQPAVEIGDITNSVTIDDKPDMTRTLTTQQVAELCDVNADTIRRRNENGTLADFVLSDLNLPIANADEMRDKRWNDIVYPSSFAVFCLLMTKS